MAVQFGTDGIRGVANSELTPELVLALGRAAARHLPGVAFLVGRDTRRSGTLLSAALSGGIAAEGVVVRDIGVIPTAGLAYLAQERGLPAAVISASHNPYFDNGIKLLTNKGTKLADSLERDIEAELDSILSLERSRRTEVVSPKGHGVGSIEVDPTGRSDYLEHLCSIIEPLNSRALKVVIDTANGAASDIAGEVFSRVGVDATVVFNEPNGTNINDGCGSTYPDALSRKVVDLGADLGLCLDGDADRLIAIDETGGILDGDHLLALFAFDLSARGELSNDAVVTTVMSNLGLRRALSGRGIELVETAVGDRNVADAIRERSLSLGGEPSGHIVFSNDATTGDGLLTGLKLVELLTRSDSPLSVIAESAMSRVPQILINVAVPDPSRLGTASHVWAEVQRAERRLGREGRVLIRSSGTENTVRVMVEATESDVAREVSAHLVEVVQSELGAANVEPTPQEVATP